MSDDWRQCVNWLVRCRVINQGHPVVSPSAKLQDLTYLLRDGVLLCQLLNVLHPDSVDARDVSLNPQASLVIRIADKCYII